MNYAINVMLLIACILFIRITAHADDPEMAEIKCGQGEVLLTDSSGICADAGNDLTSRPLERSLLLLPQQRNRTTGVETISETDDKTGQLNESENRIIIYFFWGKGCPHCEEEKSFLAGLKRGQPYLEIREYEVWNNSENAGKMAAMLRGHDMKSSGVPVTFIGERLFTGFTNQIGTQISRAIMECAATPCGDPARLPSKSAPPLPSAPAALDEVTKPDASIAIPMLGSLDTRSTSLPVLTLVIAGMDSFNPCAFFVLLSLLGLLVHARSRNKMLLIGGIFVFISGLVYFLFMAAWLNLFLVMGHVAIITTIAGLVSVSIAGINIKDYFLFKQGVSLTIPDSARPKLFERMRKLLRSTSTVSTIVGTTVLAVVANFYELLCTAGFPMVYTRILTLKNLSTAYYYLYLLLYNIVYVIPLFIIVVGFTLTLGKRQLSEWQGRILKLVSGVMMLGLGTVLLINPGLLNNVAASLMILVSSLCISFLIAAITRKSRV